MTQTFMATCLIISINRNSPIEHAEEIANLAIECHQKYPDAVIGIELSGDPTIGLFKEFVPALSRARQAGLKVKLNKLFILY